MNLHSEMKRLIWVSLQGGLFLGILAGIYLAIPEIISNRYLTHQFYYTLLSILTDTTNRTLPLAVGGLLGIALVNLCMTFLVVTKKKTLSVSFFALFLYQGFFMRLGQGLQEHIVQTFYQAGFFLIFFLLSLSVSLCLLLALLASYSLYRFICLLVETKITLSPVPFLSKALQGGFVLCLFSAIFLYGAKFFFHFQLQKQLTHKPNVIFILADALRADHLGCYGYKRPTSPFLDRFAKKSVLFTRCISQGPATIPSVMCLFTSRYASYFYNFYDMRDLLSEEKTPIALPPEEVTMAEVLREGGYVTAAISASPLVAKRSLEPWDATGFDQGFSQFDGSPVKGEWNWQWRSAEAVNHRAIAWLRNNSHKKFFLYLHYIDPHDKYHSPEPYHSLFLTRRPSEKSLGYGKPNIFWEPLREGLKINPSKEDIQDLVDYYDGEIRYLDSQIEILFHILKELDLLQNTVIFLTADHGETFFEHGDFKHGYGLHQELIHVPLMIYDPSKTFQKKRIDNLVQGIDVLPTLLNLLEIKVPPGVQGESLLPLMRDDPISWREYALSESPFRDEKALLTRDWKYIHFFTGGFEGMARARAHLREKQLYHLEKDPKELRNVIRTNRERANTLYSQLLSLLSPRERERIAKGTMIKLGEKEGEKLRSLGYLH